MPVSEDWVALWMDTTSLCVHVHTLNKPGESTPREVYELYTHTHTQLAWWVYTKGNMWICKITNREFPLLKMKIQNTGFPTRKKWPNVIRWVQSTIVYQQYRWKIIWRNQARSIFLTRQHQDWIAIVIDIWYKCLTHSPTDTKYRLPNQKWNELRTNVVRGDKASLWIRD